MWLPMSGNKRHCSFKKKRRRKKMKQYKVMKKAGIWCQSRRQEEGVLAVVGGHLAASPTCCSICLSGQLKTTCPRFSCNQRDGCKLVSSNSMYYSRFILEDWELRQRLYSPDALDWFLLWLWKFSVAVFQCLVASFVLGQLSWRW